MVERQVRCYASGTSVLYGFRHSSLLWSVAVQELGHCGPRRDQHDCCWLHDCRFHHVVPANGTVDASEVAQIVVQDTYDPIACAGTLGRYRIVALCSFRSIGLAAAVFRSDGWPAGVAVLCTGMDGSVSTFAVVRWPSAACPLRCCSGYLRGHSNARFIPEDLRR